MIKKTVALESIPIPEPVSARAELATAAIAAWRAAEVLHGAKSPITDSLKKSAEAATVDYFFAFAEHRLEREADGASLLACLKGYRRNCLTQPGTTTFMKSALECFRYILNGLVCASSKKTDSTRPSTMKMVLEQFQKMMTALQHSVEGRENESAILLGVVTDTMRHLTSEESPVVQSTPLALQRPEPERRSRLASVRDGVYRALSWVWTRAKPYEGVPCVSAIKVLGSNYNVASDLFTGSQDSLRDLVGKMEDLSRETGAPVVMAYIGRTPIFFYSRETARSLKVNAPPYSRPHTLRVLGENVFTLPSNHPDYKALKAAHLDGIFYGKGLDGHVVRLVQEFTKIVTTDRLNSGDNLASWMSWMSMIGLSSAFSYQPPEESEVAAMRATSDDLMREIVRFFGHSPFIQELVARIKASSTERFNAVPEAAEGSILRLVMERAHVSREKAMELVGPAAVLGFDSSMSLMFNVLVWLSMDPQLRQDVFAELRQLEVRQLIDAIRRGEQPTDFFATLRAKCPQTRDLIDQAPEGKVVPPILPFIPRETTEQTTVHVVIEGVKRDIQIPKGSYVFASGRDFPFGVEGRMCPGRNLAKLEAMLLLYLLSEINRFPQSEVPENIMDLYRLSGIHIPKDNLPYTTVPFGDLASPTR